jgi:hypothetical protein
MSATNATLSDDMKRRTLPMTLKTLESDPTKRNFRIRQIERWLLSKRPALLTAALTVLKAFDNAGRPKQKLPEWAGFVEFTDLIRSAIVWGGYPDPLEAREALESRGDPITDAMTRLLAILWRRHTTRFTAAELVRIAENNPDVSEALNAVVPPNGSTDRRNAVSRKLPKTAINYGGIIIDRDFSIPVWESAVWELREEPASTDEPNTTTTVEDEQEVYDL